jgi:hypothetical protein
MARLLSLGSLLALITGCSVISSQTSQSPSPSVAAAPANTGSPRKLERAAEPVSRSVQAERKQSDRSADKRTDDPLSLAADCIDRGDEPGAAAQLARHVALHPDHVVFRAQLAELLAKLERLPESQSHFEAVAALSQGNSPRARERQVHYHTRLMEIARDRDDEYAEQLHRGIGLFLVGSQLAEKGESDDAERLLCKATAALKDALELRPAEARPAWYLYRVWKQLDQPRPAERALAQAKASAPFSLLTPLEERELAMAGQSTTPVASGH